MVITASRISTGPDESSLPDFTLDRTVLDNSPALRLDDLLREQVPGFNLFRRGSSRVANPTTQGVSLRNIGPNGAGRTLVLLDGVPQNDPFGGWVYWSRLPADSIENVRIVDGGGAGVFGSAALGGVIEFDSRRPAGNAVSASIEGGSAGTYEGAIAGQWSLLHSGVTLFGRADRFSADGFSTVRPDQRGPVDIDASSETVLLDGGLTWNIGENNVFTARASGFSEDRGNGTPGTNNHSDAADFSASLAGELPETKVDYQVLMYGQLREFSSTFTSVDPTRSMEKPSLDQYSVPAQSVGGSATVVVPIGAQHSVLAGVDARWIRGETKEHFRYVNGGFLRDRDAGGEQDFAGVFAEDTWRPAVGTTISASARGDYYANADGSRHETDRTTGDTLLDEHFADHDGWVANGRLGVSQKFYHDLFRVRGAAYTGFRVPTLNELYRPFRVGNEITEANADLRPERLYGIDAGLDWNPIQPLEFSLGAYYNELHHPVANVTVADGPATVAPFGFIPAGGSGSLRENLGRASIYGLEAAAKWTICPELQLSANYLYSHGTVTSAPEQPELEGRRLAQAPLHQGIIGVQWTPLKPLQATLQTRLVGDQFDDDRNTLKLDPFVTVDVRVSLQISRQVRSWLAVENLFDAEIETGKTAIGLTSVGAPRLFNAGMSWNF